MTASLIAGSARIDAQGTRSTRPWTPVVLLRDNAQPVVETSPATGVDTPSPLTVARREAGLTVTQLARALHVSRPTVSMWERGLRGVARQYWPAIGTALGLGPDRVAALLAGRPPARLDGVPLPSLGHARRSARVTQRVLAERVGVAPTTLSMWETSGVRVPSAVAVQLARTLGTDVARLAAPPARPEPETRPLRGLRRAAGMSCREAAVHLGVAVGTLARYESGERSTPVAVLRRMATVYRRPPEGLLRFSAGVVPLPAGARWRPEDVPQAIQALRTAAGMSKVQLGRVLGRSGQAVRSWETGRTRPTPTTCRRLEAVFGLSVGRLPY